MIRDKGLWNVIRVKGLWNVIRGKGLWNVIRDKGLWNVIIINIEIPDNPTVYLFLVHTTGFLMLMTLVDLE